MTPEEETEYLKSQILKFRANPSPCTLCQGKPYVVGIFFPDNSQKYGAPDGKTRAILYALCKRCSKIPFVANRVEEQIESEVIQARKAMN